ncbi:Uncharacterised protein [Brevundimonas diminuta]|nr:Uncharacterised protein [Brevundimonas diminuta]
MRFGIVEACLIDLDADIRDDHTSPTIRPYRREKSKPALCPEEHRHWFLVAFADQYD